MIGKGLKRPLAPGRPPCTVRDDLNPEMSPSRRDNSNRAGRSRTSRSRKDAATAVTPGPCVCGCRRWKGSASTLRLASVLGLHVLGFAACSCRGFTPGGRGTARGGFLPERRTRAEVDGGLRPSGGENLLCARYPNGADGEVREGAGRRRARDRRRAAPLNSFSWSESGGGVRASECRATLVPSAPEEGRGRPGLLYDGCLLNGKGVAVADTATTTTAPTPAPRSAPRNGDINKDSDVVAERPSTVRYDEADSTVDGVSRIASSYSLALETVEPENLTARWADVVNRAAISEAPPATRASRIKQQPPGVASLATGRKWTGKDWTPRPKEGDSPSGPARKCTAKDWNGVGGGAGWRAGEVRAGSREAGVTANTVMATTSTAGASASVAAEAANKPPPTVSGIRTDAMIEAVAVATHFGKYDMDCGSRDSAVNGSVWAVETLEAQKPVVIRWPSHRELDGRAAAVAATTAETRGSEGKRSWRVWCGPLRQSDVDVLQMAEDVCATARGELTAYLLATGATHYDVSAAGAALMAVEPSLSLTGATWRRWRKNLEGLRRTGFTGSDVANMLALCPQLLALDFEGQVKPAMELLRQRLGMRPTDVRRVIRKAPEVLAPRADGSTAADAVEVLRALGMQTRHVRLEALRWPQLLAVPPANFFQLAAFLASEEVGIKAADIGSLIRQAPWLVLEDIDIDAQMLPVVKFLSRAGVTDMERVLRAYPKILGASVRGELAPRVRFLWADVGVSEDDLPRVLQTFPLVFAVPLTRMRDVVAFLSEDLTINNRDIAKIIRAFPSLLGLERERHMVGVVAYLKKLGVQNVGRFVSRLPPVLGYDVNANLRPKMDYLVEVMGLSVYDVLTFPAYFSYPLETVIEPRTQFLNIRRRPITLVGLNIALQSGDGDFARKVGKIRPDIYTDFKKAYIKNRSLVLSGQMDAESLLSESQRKAMGNLGGQFTSNNVAEVTARATGVPAKFRPRAPSRKKTAPNSFSNAPSERRRSEEVRRDDGTA